ncbi:sugar phosphate nucleotidyltransferase [Desulfurivibrio sp. D14AmB]|uniref:sugar phosphate nucleotidyltransferase n=1 Tax=Desulfurivibrio sp. D14AmB TaxID=3374370 RepID=UPI00376EF2CB
MILAAGLGTRLRPHTLVRPKPLFPVLDRPLLLLIIEQLRRAGSDFLVVNAHHLREQIAAALDGQPALVVQLEEKELGIGGGLRLARERFGREPLLVVNGDIAHNIDCRRIMAHHRAEGNDATLVLHDHPRYNNVLVGPAGDIREFGPAGEQGRLAFTGLQVINPDLLELIPPDRFYHSIDWYRQLIAAGRRVRALVVKDHFWSDMGTPADYLQLHAALLTGQAPGFGPAPLSPPVPFFYGHDLTLGRDLALRDWAVVGSNAVLGDRVSLTRCVVWDGVEIPAGTTAIDTIFSASP